LEVLLTREAGWPTRTKLALLIKLVSLQHAELSTLGGRVRILIWSAWHHWRKRTFAMSLASAGVFEGKDLKEQGFEKARIWKGKDCLNVRSIAFGGIR
jgi:hypothetical protein